jgi:predicted MPP superfamily phosphohydrolase
LPRHTRRKFLWTTLAAGGAIALGAESIVREPNHPRLNRVEISLPRLPGAFDGFTIAQLSDFHYDDYIGVIPIRAAIDIVNAVNPDLVVLTGDFVTVSAWSDILHNEKKAAEDAYPCAELLAKLRSRLGSFAVLGNHDVDASPGMVMEALRTHDILVLRNQSTLIEQHGARLWFCGVDSMSGKPKIEEALAQTEKNEAVILLAHEPDFADRAAKYPVDLQLSGHSHGGQVWVPGLGAPWLPPHARKYPRGRYQVGPLPLYTNIGLGTIRVPVRLNCVPEVTLFTLRSGGKNRS